MKIHYVRLRHFRGVADARVDFAETGVTVVEGANEQGKSSLVEAIDLLLDEPDTSTKRTIKAVKPTNRDVGAEVEAEFSTGNYRFVYRKRWHKQQETVLDITAPAPEQFTGRPAHDRVRAILDETLDQGLWAALRVEQKKVIEQVALGGNDRLARALDEASGGARESGAESTLYERIEQEYQKYFTRTGKPTGEYREAEAEYARASAEAETAREGVLEVERDIDRYAIVRADLRTLEATTVRCQSELSDLELRWREIERQQQELEDLRRLAEAARRNADDAVVAHGRRQELIGLVKGKASDLEALRQAEEEAGPVLRQAQRLLEESEKTLADAVEKAAVADEIATRAADDLAHLRDLADLEDLGGRRQRATETMQRIEEAERFLSTCEIDDGLLAELEEADLALLQARAALQAAVPTLTIEALDDTQILLDGSPVALERGGTECQSVATSREVVLPDVLRVRITPGIGGQDPESAVEQGERTFRSLLAQARATSLTQARELHRRERETRSRLDADREQLNQLVGDRSIDDVGVEVARLSGRVDEYRRNRAPEPDLLPDVPTARVFEQTVRQEAQEAREAAGHERSLRDDRQRDLTLRREDALVRSTRQEALANELEDLRKQLDEVRAGSPDQALKHAMERRTQEAALAEQKLTEQQTLLARQDPDSLEVNLTNAQEVQRRLVDDHKRDQAELTRLAGRLELAGSEGRQSRLDRALAALEEADRRQVGFRTRAEAVNLLHRTMTRHRDNAKQAYVAPFRVQLERLGRIVFGSDLQLSVDSDLRIVSRTVNGVTVPYDDLSTGTREQLCIIARLACATLVDAHEGVPVIIDDALGHSDPHRLDRMGAVFSATAGLSQVIVLTCMPERYRRIGSAQVVRLAESETPPTGDVSAAPVEDVEVPELPARPSSEDAILGALRAAGRPLGKGEILERTGLPVPAWAPAIKALQEERRVHRLGERRGATYLPIG